MFFYIFSYENIITKGKSGKKCKITMQPMHQKCIKYGLQKPPDLSMNFFFYQIFAINPNKAIKRVQPQT